MSIRVSLDNQPEFYTNLDEIAGKVILGVSRPEQISSITVKLEGEAITALHVPHPTNAAEAANLRTGPPPGPPGSVVSENHKLLYKVTQVFPDEYYSSGNSPYGAHPLQPGEHAFPFKFKLPINNACSDHMAMSKIGGLGGLGGFGSGGGLFGIGGIRVMDGSKQLFLKHVTRTLPPSVTGFPGECEVRYYVKVTVSRPGLLKENWRYQIGLKFLPIEPPRPIGNSQEAFAKRPFTFRPRSPQPEKRRSSFFGRKTADDATSSEPATPPSIEMCARLPHPPILTCNKPVPLKLFAKKLVSNSEQVYLSSFQIDLIGITEIRSHTIYNRKVNRWVITTASGLSIPVCPDADDQGKEFVIPDELWKSISLPNTISPSFSTCNLSRKYELEIKIGLSWGRAKSGGLLSSGPAPQTIWLPLHFGNIEVFSGITPPPELLEAARNTAPGAATLNFPPRLPPRTNTATQQQQHQQQQASQRPAQPTRPQGQRPVQPPISDPLYPPQLGPGQTAPPPDDAPPSYDDVMAENVSGPFDGTQSRPPYSGVTNENAPSQMPDTKAG